jgi:hypothetical protein
VKILSLLLKIPGKTVIDHNLQNPTLARPSSLIGMVSKLTEFVRARPFFLGLSRLGEFTLAGFYKLKFIGRHSIFDPRIPT